MPTDIEVGAGYVGDILAHRFPNQYRDAGDLAVQVFDTTDHYEQAPGAVMGHPRATDTGLQPPSVAYGQPQFDAQGRAMIADPDQGRELAMVEMPGVGLVAMNAHDIQGMNAVLPVEYPQAGEEGLSAVVPVSHEMADWRGTPLGSLPMGGLTESIANIVASGELDALNRSLFQLSDSIVAAYRRLDELEGQRAELKARTDAYPTFIAVGGISVPTPIGISNLETAAALKEGYTALTGFTYMVWSFRNSFTQAAPQLRRVYGAIDSMLQSMANWIRTWEEKVRPRNGQAGLFDAIQAAHNRIYAKAVPGQALNVNADAYLPSAMAAIEEVTGIKADLPAGSGAGILVSTLVAIIVAAVAFVASLVTILAIVGEFNAKGRMLHEQRQQYEARMEARRQEYAAKRSAEGATAEQIEEEWKPIREGEDQAQAKKEKDFAEAVPGTGFWDIAKKILLPAAIVVSGVVVATQVLPKVM